jgi:hypothetical protein
VTAACPRSIGRAGEGTNVLRIKVNIIIVKYKNPEAEDRCIDSVKRFTDLTKHTLTIFDNAPENINLGQLWNCLIEESKDENICLLNSDTEVEEGWDRLEESLSDPTVGAVGPITNKCGGHQKNLTRSDSIEKINDLSGFCYLFKKSIWRKVGKMPEDMPFYGQETVFNRKLEDHGYTLKVDRRVFIWHEKGSSWLKAKERGEMKMEQADYGAFHYRNYVRRLKSLREAIPQGTRVVFLGSGFGNPFPSFIGIDQTISDFFGMNAVHLPMESHAEAILAFRPDYLIVTNTRYKKDWYEQIRKVKKTGVKTALYWMDLRSPVHAAYSTGFTHSLGEYFDHIFFCAKGFVSEWEEFFKVPVTWLPQATIQHPVPPKGEHYHVLHIGDIHNHHYHQNRMAVFNQLRDSGIAIEQKNETDRERRVELSKRSYGLYGSADFSLSVSLMVEGYTSDRTYHILGSGGVLVGLDPGGLDHLKPYAFFEKDGEGIVKRIQNTTEEEREAIKRKAFDFAQSRELYKDRYVTIFRTLCNIT